MADAAEAWIEVQAVERTFDPTSGDDRVRVRFAYGGPGSVLFEWTIWLPDEGPFESAIHRAREELRRISSLVAFGGAAGQPGTASR